LQVIKELERIPVNNMENGKHRLLKINILFSKFVRRNIREINVTFVENLDTFRITA
jgi:hypothetical protein